MRSRSVGVRNFLAANAAFWFIMSMALIAGFMCAYPMNWWLVTRHLKHGMMTVRKDSPGPHAGHDMASMGPGEHANHDMNRMPSFGTILAVGALSLAILAGAVVIVANTLPAAG